MPEISIIIPCYKMGRFISDALSSIATQTFSDWEVILVDDAGPEDGTKAAVADFASRFPNHRVEFISHGINLGTSAARNSAMALASGTFLAFLDPDDFWLPNHLETHINAHRSETEEVVTVSTARIISGGPGICPLGLRQVSEWEAKVFPLGLVMGNAIIPTMVMLPSQVVKNVGGFDTSLRIGEDWDLWIRLSEAGVQFVFIREITANYRLHPGAATSSKRDIQKCNRSLYSKHSDTWRAFTTELLYRQSQRIEELEKSHCAVIATAVVRLSLLFDRVIRKCWRVVTFFKPGSFQ